MKKILFITDAWEPQVSGVVTVLEKLVDELKKKGFEVRVIHPGLFRTAPLPTYSEIKLAIFPWKKLKKKILKENPDYIHIPTEGPVGFAGARACRRLGIKFTTAYHTKMPDYINSRTKIPKKFSYSILKRFHRKSEKTLVPTESIKQDLEERGFKNLQLWSLGVDTKLFKKNLNPKIPKEIEKLPKPIFVYFGRIAVDKSIEDFLKLDLPGSKLIIGGGPEKKKLEKKYDDVVFTGYKKNQELVDLLSISNVCVFPSKTDTFGLTIIEAMACGLPVAAYKAPGAIDIIRNGINGYIGSDLQKNALDCLKIDSKKCREIAEEYSWEKSAEIFISTQGEIDNLP